MGWEYLNVLLENTSTTGDCWGRAAGIELDATLKLVGISLATPAGPQTDSPILGFM